MPKYHVEMTGLDGFSEHYELWAEDEKEAKEIAEKRPSSQGIFHRHIRILTENQKKHEDDLMLTAGLVIVPALVIRGLWVGAKGLWEGGKFAYRVARNPEIVSNYIETKRKAIEKNNDLRKEKFEELAKSRQISAEERNRISRQMWISGAKFFLYLTAMCVVGFGLMTLLRR